MGGVRWRDYRDLRHADIGLGTHTQIALTLTSNIVTAVRWCKLGINYILQSTKAEKSSGRRTMCEPVSQISCKTNLRLNSAEKTRSIWNLDKQDKKQLAEFFF